MLVAVAIVACATSSSRAGAGEECFLASDCEDGLVCVPQANGGRVCSNDISRVAGKPPTGEPPSEAGADAAEAGPDAPVEDAPMDAPGDTGVDAADAAGE